MSYLDQLATRALLGTSRDVGALPVAPDAIAGVLGASAVSPEAAILRAAGVYCLYERAGRLAERTGAVVEGPLADARPACSERALGVLRRVLGTGKGGLVGEWLTSCASAGQRPPAAVVPTLLDAATRVGGSGALRGPTAAAVGALGLWLCKLNPEWSAVLAEDSAVDARVIWETGSKLERLRAIKRLRGVDPAAARELVATTFTADPAAERAAFVGTFGAGLSPADETFLEACLDDRSKEVRTNAATLLARIEGSAFVGRMIGRAAPLLTFTPPEPARLLRKAKPGNLTVELPAAYDETMKRDGIDEKPHQGAGYGERQYWLMQVLSMVPPGYWSERFDVSPAHLLEAIPKDYENLLQVAWNSATVNAADPAWAEAFIRLGKAGKQQQLNEHLIKLLAAERRNEVIYDLLAAGGMSSDSISELISHGTLDVRCTRALAGLVRERARNSKTAHDWELARLLPQAAMAVPPSMRVELEKTWLAEDFAAVRNAHEEFFATLALREEIQKEFAS